MKKTGKNKRIIVIVIVLAIALIGSVLYLGNESRVAREKANKEAAQMMQKNSKEKMAEEKAKEEAKKKSDKEKANQQKSQSSQSKSGGKAKKDNKKDLGGGLYLNPDGSIETEILP